MAEPKGTAMSEQNNHWIVLINRVPRGPLSEDELRSLLNLGVVRINDVAYRVDPKNPKSTSEWRFLWQFNEFDRRKPADGVSAPLERRSQVDETKLRKKISEHIPEELHAILPEDLIVRGHHEHFSAERHAEHSDEPMIVQPRSANRRLVTVGVVLFLVFVGTYGLYTGQALRDNLSAQIPVSTAPTVPMQPARTTTIRPPTSRRTLSLPQTVQETAPAPAVAPAKIQQKSLKLPKEPDRDRNDRGEVTEEQTRRLEDDRKAREEDDRDREPSDEDEEDAKPKKKKKRAISNDEELEDAIEDNDDYVE